MSRSQKTKPTQKVPIERIDADGRRTTDDIVVTEVPFTIFLNGTDVGTLLCSPCDLEFLAAGYLLTEGFIDRSTELSEMTLSEKGWYIHVNTTGEVHLPEGKPTRRLVTSGCGQAGAALMKGVGIGLPEPVSSEMKINHEDLLEGMKQFLQDSDLFRETGAVHSCAVACTQKIKYRADDIGRHNALDKAIGWCLQNDVATEDKAVLTTGRSSSEMVLKSVRGGIPIIVSHSAPTSLAVELAEKLNATLVGFARGGRMNIYSHGSRIE